jgi:hypothetical protein
MKYGIKVCTEENPKGNELLKLSKSGSKEILLFDTKDAAARHAMKFREGSSLGIYFKIFEKHINKKVTIEDLFKTWEKELGYNKAVLLSCCYSVKTVLGYSDEDAEAEVEALEGGI